MRLGLHGKKPGSAGLQESRVQGELGARERNLETTRTYLTIKTLAVDETAQETNVNLENKMKVILSLWRHLFKSRGKREKRKCREAGGKPVKDRIMKFEG